MAHADTKVSPPKPVSRKQLLVSLIKFQLKLLADGFRDVVLSPLSLIATLHGMLFAPDEPDRYFQRLMKLGRDSDRFINLFEQHPEDGNPAKSDQPEPSEPTSESS